MKVDDRDRFPLPIISTLFTTGLSARAQKMCPTQVMLWLFLPTVTLACKWKIHRICQAVECLLTASNWLVTFSLPRREYIFTYKKWFQDHEDGQLDLAVISLLRSQENCLTGPWLLQIDKGASASIFLLQVFLAGVYISLNLVSAGIFRLGPFPLYI